MSLPGYIRKSKPALWTAVKGARLTRGASKPVKAPKARTRIKTSSKRMTALRRAYLAKRDAWIVGKSCHKCGDLATECHHTRGRAGSLMLDERHWLPMCSWCHQWVHEHPADARADGLLCSKGMWNKPDNKP